MVKKLLLSVKFILVFLFSGQVFLANAQELNARVEILSPQVPNANSRTLEVLQRVMTDFLNNRSWTGKQVLPQERINCNFVITIHSWDGSSEYVAQAQILSVRPVFETTYDSPVLNMVDKDFNFSYVEGQMVDYSDQQFTSNLTSLLAYYAYVILGMDMDTFSREGGTSLFNNAQQVLNNAQNGGFLGWRSMDGNENRYWLINNLQDRRYLPLRHFHYEYFRNGLDRMAGQPQLAQENIKNLLPSLRTLERFGQGAVLDQIFFTSRSSELVGIFGGMNHQDRMQAYQLLMEVDPANGNKYEVLRNR